MLKMEHKKNKSQWQSAGGDLSQKICPVLKKPWLIMGSTHYIGRSLVKEAKARGMMPIVADTSITRLRRFAERHQLPWCLVSLEDTQALAKAFSKVYVVVNGYSASLRATQECLEACLQSGAHYVDGCQDYRILSLIYRYHQKAERKKIWILPGCGLSSITESLVRTMVDQALLKHEQKAVEPIERVPFKFILTIEGFEPKNLIHLGSMLSMGIPWGIEWQKGILKRLKMTKRVRRVVLRHETKMGVVFPSVDLITLPRQFPIESFRTLLIQPTLYTSCFAVMGWLNEQLGPQVTQKKTVLNWLQKSSIRLSKYLRTKIEDLKNERLYIWLKGKRGDLELPMLGIETEGLYPLILNMQLQAVQALIESPPSQASFGVISLSSLMGEKKVLQGESRVSYGVFCERSEPVEDDVLEAAPLAYIVTEPVPVREKQVIMQSEAVL
jgi:Saccharopine dehydrogenase NADP binding domain